MGFIKSLVSKVAVAVAVGAAEQSARHATNDWWKGRKQTQGEKQDDQEVPVVDPPRPFNMFRSMADRVQAYREKREAKAWLAKQTKPEPETVVEETPVQPQE